jgi:hypothetical protein
MRNVLFFFALSLLFTGCGGGGGGGSSDTVTPPTIVTLGGVDFDVAQSGTSPYFSSTAPSITLYLYGPSVDSMNRLSFTYVYSSTSVGGVPGVQVARSRRQVSSGALQQVQVTVFAKATDGGVYIISNQRGTGFPYIDWTAGLGGAVPSRYLLPLPATSGTYLGGYRQQYAPATPGGEETMSTPTLNSNTPSGLFNAALQVYGYDGGEFLRQGEGIIEIDESAITGQPAGTTGWKAVIPASG